MTVFIGYLLPVLLGALLGYVAACLLSYWMDRRNGRQDG